MTKTDVEMAPSTSSVNEEQKQPAGAQPTAKRRRVKSEAAPVEMSSRGPKNLTRTFPKKGGAKQKFTRNSASRLDANEVTIDAAKVEEYRFIPVDHKRFARVASGVQKKLLRKKQHHVERSAVRAARTELLHHEDAGFITLERGESSEHVTQRAIGRSCDMATASKRFTLELRQHAPYRMAYTGNGRHLLLGGRMGHLAAFDWHDKRLTCETAVNEVVRDVTWLHTDVMFAAAQNKWTYIYDKQGVELHCIKQMHDIRRLLFLPYHFLLVGGSHSTGGLLHWLDVSIGQMVRSTLTKLGSLRLMQQNPANAVVLAGHGKGTVSMWTPNVAEPVAKMQAHGCALRAIAVRPDGTQMATAGVDQLVRLWDVRTYKQLCQLRLPSPAGHLAYSQRKLLACAIGNTVQIFGDPSTEEAQSPYLSYAVSEGSVVSDMHFCPYEDVLGIGHQSGFDSIIVPGAGEPQYDWTEANPFEAKNQRREKEIRALLDKIPHDMITVDTSAIGRVDEVRLEETLAQRAAVLHTKMDKVDFTPRHRAKGKNKPTHKEHRKQTVLEQRRKAQVDDAKEARQQLADMLGGRDEKPDLSEPAGTRSALDRFARKQW